MKDRLCNFLFQGITGSEYKKERRIRCVSLVIILMSVLLLIPITIRLAALKTLLIIITAMGSVFLSGTVASDDSTKETKWMMGISTILSLLTLYTFIIRIITLI